MTTGDRAARAAAGDACAAGVACAAGASADAAPSVAAPPTAIVPSSLAALRITPPELSRARRGQRGENGMEFCPVCEPSLCIPGGWEPIGPKVHWKLGVRYPRKDFRSEKA